MRTLAFDGRTGASGDMLLAALLAAGADRDALAPVEAALDLRYVVDRTERNGIAATAVDVVLTEESGGDGDPEVSRDGSHDHQHSPDDEDDDHHHHHSHDEGDHHSDDATPAEGHGPHRSYEEVCDVVREMDLDEDVTRNALAVFEALGEAEATVHGRSLAETHFHEVGADDAIADVVGVCLLLADLDVERVVTTPVSAGGGEVEMAHGTYPVPAPAVVELADGADWSLRGGPIDAELLTPTGTAILAHFAEGVESLPSMRVSASGYGAGGWTFEDRPNVLRAVVGEAEGRLARDDITVLETNLDDVAPEVLGDLQRSLADAGARDVSIIPATMKKARPGHLVKVICKPEDAQRIARRLAEETGTLGIREHGAGHRWIAQREMETAEIAVDGETHEVAVKVASDEDGVVYDVSAEFDDAAAVADATGLPVREVMRRAESQYRE